MIVLWVPTFTMQKASMNSWSCKDVQFIMPRRSASWSVRAPQFGFGCSISWRFATTSELLSDKAAKQHQAMQPWMSLRSKQMWSHVWFYLISLRFCTI